MPRLAERLAKVGLRLLDNLLPLEDRFLRRFSFPRLPPLSSSTSLRGDLRGDLREDGAWDALDGAMDGPDGLARTVSGASFFIRDSFGSFLTRSAESSAITGRASALTDFPNLLTYSLIHLFTSSPIYLPIDLPTQIHTYLPTYGLLTY